MPWSRTMAQTGLGPSTCGPAGSGVSRASLGGQQGADRTAQLQVQAPRPQQRLKSQKPVRGCPRPLGPGFPPARSSLLGARWQSVGSEAGQDQTRPVMGIGILY